MTRRGVQVDRIASAWLIRRFLDPRARFRFVDPPSRPVAADHRFDIVPGDFTHEGTVARSRLSSRSAGIARPRPSLRSPRSCTSST